MNVKAAQLFGASLGILVTTSYLAWQRLRPPPCTGAVFVELRPPLSDPGPYRFRLQLDDSSEPCEFEVALPAKRGVDTKRCKMALALETRVQGKHSSIVGLTLGAAPEELTFQVRRGSELVYDTRLALRYAPYETLREESKRFCGDRAFVKPACVPGSSQCTPFPASCRGPEACADGKVCCVNPDQGREYGVHAASECSFRRACLDRFGQIACTKAGDCPDDMRCDDTSLARYFREPITVCSSRSATRH